VAPDPKFFRAVESFPLPQNITELKAFLGLVNWQRRFIKDNSNLAMPLTKSTKKAAIFHMGVGEIKHFASYSMRYVLSLFFVHRGLTYLGSSQLMPR
jgi:hypothetical protein